MPHLPPARSATAPGPGRRPLSRRSFLGAAALGSLALGLSACGGPDVPQVRFYQSKPEAIPYFKNLLKTFNEQQDGKIEAIHDSASNLSSGFARADPPDLGCLNYNYEMARFQERGELSDLSDLQAEANIADSIQQLVDQYPTYPGRVCTIPYSMMAAAVFYNKAIFDQHGVQVPQTWSQLLEVCEKLKSAGVTPFYLTSADAWTVSQGIADYSIGGAIDVGDFFQKLRAQGKDSGPDREISFTRVFKEPLSKALRLMDYANDDAANRKYGDGNVAFANGQAAMYLQGPWALNEILTVNPQADIGIFPLPMTEDPADRKVRVNLDLALWIPEKSDQPEAARTLLRYLITPEVADAYNQQNLGFGVRNDSPPVTDPRLQDLQKYVDRSAFYQGASVSMPKTVPFENYMQGIFTGQDLEETLRKLDGDWHRLAERQPAKD